MKNVAGSKAWFNKKMSIYRVKFHISAYLYSIIIANKFLGTFSRQTGKFEHLLRCACKKTEEPNNSLTLGI